MPIKQRAFRAYDIRGLVGEDFREEDVEPLGRACGTWFLRQRHKTAVVGRDCRLSSPAFHAALCRGLLAAGVDVISVGMTPTPALYFAIRHLRRHAGVMITASHNPPLYNGFKIWSGKSTIHGAAIQEIYRIATEGSFTSGQGLYSEHDILPSYERAVLSRLRLRRPVKVVADGGNGAGGPTLVNTLRAMGAETIPLYCEPDGAFPNHHPDPAVEDNMRDLIARVREEGADLGIGLDGDADRLGVVDGQGRLLAGDELLAVFARDLLERLPGALVLADVKCSGRLFDQIREMGGRARMCVTGHSLVKAEMLRDNAPLAGELSGHIFFNEGWYGFDDAIYGAARLLDILSRRDEPLTALPGWPPAFSTREVHIPCPEEKKIGVARRAQKHFGARYPVECMDGARVTFAHGWGLVRASNTQPALVLRFEADSPENLAAIRREMEDAVTAWIQEGEPPQNR